MEGPKKQWVKAIETMATEKHPEWRQQFENTNKRLPPEMRREVEAWLASKAPRSSFIEGLLSWLGVTKPSTETVSKITERLDAVLEFAIFVVRGFLLGNYGAEKHESDVYDQFQLQYLAMERFVLVSGDSDLSKRTIRSSQADRIMSFQEFLRTV
jgi:hypothetical protein